MLAMIWMVFGAGFYSFTLGSLSSLLANLDTRRSHLTNKLMLMDQFCKENKFSKALKTRVKKALEYSSIKTIFSSDDKNKLLNEIPTDLRFEIAEMLFEGLSNRVPFFKNKDKSFIANFVPLLNPLKVLHGELIYRKNEYPNLVYFIYNGRVNYVVGPQNIAFKSMVQGSYFGEIEIYENKLRYFNCRAEKDCDLLTIPADKFISQMHSFPDHEADIRKIIEERKKRNEIALEKISSIAPISVNSEFWKKKKEVNLYEAVKMKRKHMNTIHLDQNIAENSNNSGNSSKIMTKFKRFLTNFFTKDKKNSNSFNKQSSQESDSQITSKFSVPSRFSLAKNKVQPFDENNSKELENIKENSLFNIKENESFKDSVKENFPKKSEEKLLAIDTKNPLLSNKLNEELDHMKIRKATSKKPTIIVENQADLLQGRTQTLMVSPHSEDPLISQKESGFSENLAADLMTSSKKSKRVTIQSPQEFKFEEKKSVFSGNSSKIASNEQFLGEKIEKIAETSRFRSRTDCARKNLMNEIKSNENSGKNEEKTNGLLGEIKEDEEIVRNRSKTEVNRKKTSLLVRKPSARRFSTFKNREIYKIIESFSQKTDKTQQISGQNKSKSKKKSKKIGETLALLKKTLRNQQFSQENHRDFLERLSSDVEKINESLKIACKRHRILKENPYIFKKNSFFIGKNAYKEHELQIPKVFHHKNGDILQEKDVEELPNMNFPEPDNFLL